MKLPLAYRWLIANGFEGFVPWLLLDEPGEMALRLEFQRETDGDFYPFARRQDRDDFAGFKVIDGEVDGSVVSVHLTWLGKREQEGWPHRKEYKDMFEWLKEEVIPDTWEWMSESELGDLEENA